MPRIIEKTETEPLKQDESSEDQVNEAFNAAFEAPKCNEVEQKSPSPPPEIVAQKSEPIMIPERPRQQILESRPVMTERPPQ